MSLLGVIALRGKETAWGNWETLSVNFGNWAAWLEALGGANVEDEGDNVEFAPETATNVWRELDKAAGNTSTDEFHQVL